MHSIADICFLYIDHCFITTISQLVRLNVEKLSSTMKVKAKSLTQDSSVKDDI